MLDSLGVSKANPTSTAFQLAPAVVFGNDGVGALVPDATDHTMIGASTLTDVQGGSGDLDQIGLELLHLVLGCVGLGFVNVLGIDPTVDIGSAALDSNQMVGMLALEIGVERDGSFTRLAGHAGLAVGTGIVLLASEGDHIALLEDDLLGSLNGFDLNTQPFVDFGGDLIVTVIQVIAGAGLVGVVTVNGHITTIQMVHTIILNGRPHQLLDAVPFTDVSHRSSRAAYALSLTA